MLLLLPLAFAHPGSAPGGSATARDFIGHRMELTIEADAVELHYVAEIPESRVLADARASGDPDYGRTLLGSLDDGVHILWNGAPLPVTALAVENAVKAGENGFLDFQLALRAERPVGPGRIGVRDGNYPDEPGFYATSVTLAPEVIAETTSLLEVKNGKVRNNWHGAWVRDESGREPWVQVRPATYFERASGPLPLPQRMADIGSDTPSPLMLLALVLLLVPIAWLGRTLGRRANRNGR